MKLKHYVLTGLVALSFTGLSGVTDANAKTTYQSVPHAIRGYYISESGNLGLMITAHRIVEAIPAADAETTTITHVNKSGHKYAIHGYSYMGKKYYNTVRLSHFKKNKLYGSYVHATFTKTNKYNYYDFLNPFG